MKHDKIAEFNPQRMSLREDTSDSFPGKTYVIEYVVEVDDIGDLGRHSLHAVAIDDCWEFAWKQDVEELYATKFSDPKAELFEEKIKKLLKLDDSKYEFTYDINLSYYDESIVNLKKSLGVGDKSFKFSATNMLVELNMVNVNLKTITIGMHYVSSDAKLLPGPNVMNPGVTKFAVSADRNNNNIIINGEDHTNSYKDFINLYGVGCGQIYYQVEGLFTLFRGNSSINSAYDRSSQFLKYITHEMLKMKPDISVFKILSITMEPNKCKIEVESMYQHEGGDDKKPSSEYPKCYILN